jgi:transcription antitermination protein NusB
MANAAMISARRTARERALELLYESEIKSLDVVSLLGTLPITPDPYAVLLVEGVAQHEASHDELIAGFLRSGWTMGRIPTIDRLILRLAVEELLHQQDVPVAVVLDESVRLAKSFSTDESGRFVNGLLAAVARSARSGRESGGARPTVDDEQPAHTWTTTATSAAELSSHSEFPAGLTIEQEPPTVLDV